MKKGLEIKHFKYFKVSLREACEIALIYLLLSTAELHILIEGTQNKRKYMQRFP